MTTYYLSTSGGDANPGSLAWPFRTFAKALSVLQPGDILEVQGGTYRERLTSPRTRPGTAAKPVIVRAAPGERPVIEGLLWLKYASYWTFDGINVTWSARNKRNEHMVKFREMTGWRFTNAEVWGARSYAAILVSGVSSNWRIDHCYVHDTYKSNGTNQDHLIYVNTIALGGVIERNVLANSPNGRAVKVGPPSGSTTPIGGVTIRYNTMFLNAGPSNVQLSYGASRNVIYRNLMKRVRAGQTNITAYNLNGDGNLAYDNGGWESAGVMRPGYGIEDGGGNVMFDPSFANPVVGDFTPTNPAALAYGHLADDEVSE